MSKNTYEESLGIIEMIERENEDEQIMLVEALACISANKRIGKWDKLDEEEQESAFEAMSVIASKYFAYYNAMKTIKKEENK